MAITGNIDAKLERDQYLQCADTTVKINYKELDGYLRPYICFFWGHMNSLFDLFAEIVPYEPLVGIDIISNRAFTDMCENPDIAFSNIYEISEEILQDRRS